jgi:hypothetical protein
VALEGLSAEEAAELGRMLTGRRVSLTDLSALLLSHSIRVSPFVLGWHRRGRCACARLDVAA